LQIHRPLPGRRAILSIAAAALAVGVAPRVLAQTRPEKARIVIAVVGSTASLQFLPLLLAERLGYFASEGLQVVITEHASGDGAMQALSDASADVVAGSFEQAILEQARKRFVQTFALMGRAPQVAFGVSNRTLPVYRSMADLRGRKIGVAASGSSGRLVASLVLARGGVAPEHVVFVELPSVAAAVASLRAGQVDAMSHTEPVMTVLEHKSDVRIISDTRTLKGTQEVFGGPMPSACLFATEAFLQKNPLAAQALANAVVHALKWLQTAGPSDLIKAVPEPYLLGDRGLYLAAFNKIRETIALDGLIAEEGARTALNAVARFDRNIKPGTIDMARAFTNDFARKAKGKFLV